MLFESETDILLFKELDSGPHFEFSSEKLSVAQTPPLIENKHFAEEAKFRRTSE